MSNPVTFAFDGNDPATQIESRYWVSEVGNPASLKLIDSVNDAQGIGHDLTQYGAIFAVGSNLYTVLNSNAVNIATVFKSQDGGVTWAAVDAANGPNVPLAQLFDATGNRIIVLHTAAKVFRAFDLVTETWGLDFGAGAPAGLTTLSFMALRPDNTIFVLTSQGFAVAANVTTLIAAVYDITGATWSVTFDPSFLNVSGLANYNGLNSGFAANRISYYQDSAGRIGIFMRMTSFNNVPSPWDGRTFFQQLLLNDTGGVFFEFPNGPTDLIAPSPGGGPSFGCPVVLAAQDTIVLPITKAQPAPDNGLAYMSLYTGTPISAPVWTELNGAGIDPGSRIIDGGDGSLTPQSFATGATDGTNLWFAWMTTDATQAVNVARVRISQTTAATPTAGWTATTLYDMTLGLPVGFYPSPPLPAPNQQALFNPTLFFSSAIAPPGPAQTNLIYPMNSATVLFLPNPATVCGTKRRVSKEFQRPNKRRC